MNSHRTQTLKSWLILLGMVVTLTPALAAFGAGNKAAEAEKHHAQGLRHYNLGRFDEAIVEFQSAYDLDPDPTLLFNLAQAHKQSGKLEKAIFFLKRYLQMAPKAKDRREVERRIRDLENTLAAREEQRAQPAPPPPASMAEAPPSRSTGSPVTTLSQEPVFSAPPVPPSQPPPPVAPPTQPTVEEVPDVSMRILGQLGLNFPWLAGNRQLGHPGLLAAAVSAAYVIPLEGMSLDFGVMGGYSPFTYHTATTNKTVYADLISALATVTLHVQASDTFAVEPGIGVGAVWWRGLAQDNPFTKNGIGATGPIPMPSARLSFAMLWNISPVAHFGVVPTFDFSVTTGSALTATIASVSRFGANAVIALGF